VKTTAGTALAAVIYRACPEPTPAPPAEPVEVDLATLLLVRQALERRVSRLALARALRLDRDKVRRALLAIDAYDRAQGGEPPNAAEHRNPRLRETLERVEIIRRPR
jgi:hypothetical protein